MKIGIVGSGNIGGTAGKLWAEAGHEVMFASRHPEQLGSLAEEAGGGAKTGTPEEAAAFGDVVLVALPGKAVEGAIPSLGDLLEGKVLIDASNGDGGPASVSRLLPPGARLVRALNTMASGTLGGKAHLPEGERLVLPYAGEDEGAKRTVEGLIRDAGFAPLDVGSFAGASVMEYGGALWNKPLRYADAQAVLAEAREASGEPLPSFERAKRPDPGDAAAYFEQITKAVFQAGMSWKTVEAKWDGFRRDFHGFDPGRVAAMDDEEVARVEADPDVIRNKRKIEATVANAKTMNDLIGEHGDFAAYLHSFPSPEAAMKDLEARFEWLGDSGAWWFLETVGEPTPALQTQG